MGIISRLNKEGALSLQRTNPVGHSKLKLPFNQKTSPKKCKKKKGVVVGYVVKSPGSNFFHVLKCIIWNKNPSLIQGIWGEREAKGGDL